MSGSIENGGSRILQILIGEWGYRERELGELYLCTAAKEDDQRFGGGYSETVSGESAGR